MPQLSADPALADNAFQDTLRLLEFGKPVGYWRISLIDGGGDVLVSDERGSSPDGELSIQPADYRKQEDTFIATWSGPASLVIQGNPVNFQQQLMDDAVLELTFQILEADVSHASLAMGEGKLDITEKIASLSGTGWQTSRIRLSCFADLGARLESMAAPLVITAEGSLKLQITSALLNSGSFEDGCEL
jgi:beta-glucosidase